MKSKIESQTTACSVCSQTTDPEKLGKCYACDTRICAECLEENGAYTYPDSLPYCPGHQPAG